MFCVKLLLKRLKKLKDLIENQLVRDYIDLEKLYIRKNVKVKTFQQVTGNIEKLRYFECKLWRFWLNVVKFGYK